MTDSIPTYPEMRCQTSDSPSINGKPILQKVAVMADTLVEGKRACAVVMVSNDLITDGADPIELATPDLIEALEEFIAKQ